VDKDGEEKWLLLGSESESDTFPESMEISASFDNDSAARLSDKERATSSTSRNAFVWASGQGNTTDSVTGKKADNDNSALSANTLTSRRNAICDVIEKQTHSGTTSLRKDREDLLRIMAGNRDGI